MSALTNTVRHPFTPADLASAGLRILPHLPLLISNNRQLGRLIPGDIQSTGLMFETMAQQQPRSTFLVFEGEQWTYEAFNRRVNQLAHLFKRYGIRSGDCVALMFENRPELLACVLAANKLGAVAGLLNHNQQGEVLRHSLSLLNPAMVVVGEECLQAFEPQRAHLGEHVTLFHDGAVTPLTGYRDLKQESREQSHGNPPETHRVQLGQPCYYIFTSGTTGMPKAAKMTHLRWFKAGLGMGKTAMRLNADDTLYCPLPFYHNNALTVALSSVILSGAAIALARKFSTSSFWHDIRATGATSFIYIGELCRYLLSAPAHADDRNHRVRVVIGNGMRPEVWDEFQSRFGIEHVCEFYGASEGNLAFVNLFNLKRTAGFCPMRYAIVKFDADAEQPLKNSAGYLQRVRRGETGLLLSEVTRHMPFDGYTENKATEAKLLRNVFVQGDCWFNTGDLVMDQGFRHIAFVDRVGDTFRWKGENVATTEVEGAIQRIAGVEEAVVYGVQIPHCDGRAGMAAITLKEGSACLPENFLQQLQAKLPAYAIPVFVRIQSQQEITATFKNKKTHLKQQAYQLENGTDAVFVLAGRNGGYEKLTPEQIHNIEAGSMKF